MNLPHNKRKLTLLSLACCREAFDHPKLDLIEQWIEKETEAIMGEGPNSFSMLALNHLINLWHEKDLDEQLFYTEQCLHCCACIGEFDYLENQAQQVLLLNEIYHPYPQVEFPRQAIEIAQRVYDKDEKARFVLSDCLEEYGFPEEIHTHLRTGEHPKGCWLIDQILGKS